MDWKFVIGFFLVAIATAIATWILRRRANKPSVRIRKVINSRAKGSARPPTEEEKPVFYAEKAKNEAERLTNQIGVTGVMHYYPEKTATNHDGFEMFLIGNALPDWYLAKLKKAEYIRHFRPLGRDDQHAVARWLNEISEQMRLLAAQAHAQNMEITELPEFYAAALDFLARNYGTKVAKQKAILGLTYAVGNGKGNKGTATLSGEVIPLLTNYLTVWSPSAQRKARPTVGSMRAISDQIQPEPTSPPPPAVTDSMLLDMAPASHKPKEYDIENAETQVPVSSPNRGRSR